MSARRIQQTATSAPWDNSRAFVHSPKSSTGRQQVRLWIGGELKLRLSSPAPIRADARNENTPQGWLSGLAAIWKRLLPGAEDVFSPLR